ncbi:MAG: hypothetical protein KDC38_13395 [Planctomycetes bacterium]|nr:hypothetical protein [Planctomycetota bacterium]
MQKLRRKKFGEILVAEGIITRDQLSETLEVQQQTGETIGEILLRERLISESDIVRCICTQYQLPFIRPAHYELDGSLLDLFGPEFLFIHRMLPLDVIGNVALVALSEVPTPETEEEVKQRLGKELYYAISMATDVETILKEHFSIDPERALQLEHMRRGQRHRPAQAAQGPGARAVVGQAPPAPTAARPAAAASPAPDFGSNWESIFDEAERNV